MFNPTMNGGNGPQNAINNILNMKIGDIKNTPQYQQVLKMTYGKSPEEIEQMVQQMARERGIDLNILKGLIGNR